MRLITCLVLLAGFASFAYAEDPDPRNGAISGIVAGPDGAGLADLSVKLYPAKDSNKKIAFADAPKRPGMDALAETKTDKDGKFKFENIAPGNYMIIAGDMIKGLGRTPATVKEGKTVEVKITVRRRRVA